MESFYNEKLSREWMEWVEKSNPQWTREKEIFPFIKSRLEEWKPYVLADIGCGQGSCSGLVSDETDYIGIDPSPMLIERANELHLSANKKFIGGSAYDIPLGSTSVDAVISVWVWSHLDNIKLAADEVFRVLKTWGRFLIISAHPETYEERKTFYTRYAIQDNLLTGTFNLGEGKTLTDTTLYLHTEERIRNAIEEAGLRIDHIKKMWQMEYSGKWLYLAIECTKQAKK